MMRITFKEPGLERNAQFLPIEANYHCSQIAVVDMVEEEEETQGMLSTCLEEQWMHQPAEPSPCIGACHPHELILQLSARRDVQPQFAGIKLPASISSTTFPPASFPQLWRLADHWFGLEARLAVNSRCPRILWRGGIEELLLQLADLPHVPRELLESHCTTHEPTKAPQSSSFRLHINLSIKLLSVQVIRLVHLAWASWPAPRLCIHMGCIHSSIPFRQPGWD